MRFVAAVSVVAVMAGCGGATSPHPFGGSYDLVSVDGKADPQPLIPGTTGPKIVGGTLVVSADTLTVTLDERSTDDVGHAIGDVIPVIQRIGYARQGDILVFTNGSTGSSGVILGNNVKLTFEVTDQFVTGIGQATRHFLFAPSLGR